MIQSKRPWDPYWLRSAQRLLFGGTVLLVIGCALVEWVTFWAGWLPAVLGGALIGMGLVHVLIARWEA